MADAKVTNASILKTWNEFAGKEDEFTLVSETDVNGVKTTALRNKLTGSLVAEVPAGEEQRLVDEIGEPTLTVAHSDKQPERTFIDDRGGENEDVTVHTGDEAEKKLQEQADEAAKNADAQKTEGGNA